MQAKLHIVWKKLFMPVYTWDVKTKEKMTFIALVLKVMPTSLYSCCLVILSILHEGSASVEFLGER